MTDECKRKDVIKECFEAVQNALAADDTPVDSDYEEGIITGYGRALDVLRALLEEEA